MSKVSNFGWGLYGSLRNGFSAAGSALKATANAGLSSYYSGMSSDLSQYYSDYLKNTGLKASEIKYPYKSGYNQSDYYSYMSAMQQGSMYSNIADAMTSVSYLYG